ncbi:MAG TPA: hypothetical protein VFH27_03870 [Longimicrobiaceae bacterium]|nr:hypothetical protein [Longimicrobiaceae bacterium]
MATDPTRQGGEDTAAAEHNVREAEENRDALAAQARRTDRTAPDETNRPVQPSDASRQGLSASPAGPAPSTPRPGADASRAAAENRDALAQGARGVEQSLPRGVDTDQH